MFDVFYLDKKPSLFSHERPANDLSHACSLSRTRFFWIVNYLCDYTGWDWIWEPPPWQAHQRHAWSSRWQVDCGTYLVPRLGFSDTNYHTVGMSMKSDRSLWHDLPDDWDITWHPDYRDPCYIYQFGTQWQKTGGPRYVMPGATEIKYVAKPRCDKKVVDPYWSIPDNMDKNGFDWTWHPDSTDQPYIYQFGTQWQKTGGPRYVMPGATEIKYVDQIRVEVKTSSAVVVVIDHLDGAASIVCNQMQNKARVIRTSRYVDNYLDTLKRIANNCDDDVDYLWICSSICDYQDFDFTWHPEQWQASMLHVFPSGDQKFGDTFFMHVPSFRARCDIIQLLDWYDLNFVNDIKVPRRSPPIISHEYDSHVESLREVSWHGPVAVLLAGTSVPDHVPCINLWRESTKAIVPLDPAGAAIVVPKNAVPYVKTQIYDYPYIDRAFVNQSRLQPLDIVFISNGEYAADNHWNILNQSVPSSLNKIHRIDGINGRVAAYQAAAQASQTSWFFAVFAKLQVNQDFDWRWQPDRLQQPKHYIFHAYNPVNHLVYGHQAMIAYNRKLVLENTGHGLDFTLDQAHQVVPIISGTAYYDCDPWTCWRTAFRECIKLRHSLPDPENQHRLEQWISIADGTNGHWSQCGAQDALVYYESVSGKIDDLKKSYEWAWLASYAVILHPELFTQSNT